MFDNYVLDKVDNYVLDKVDNYVLDKQNDVPVTGRDGSSLS